MPTNNRAKKKAKKNDSANSDQKTNQEQNLFDLLQNDKAVHALGQIIRNYSDMSMRDSSKQRIYLLICFCALVAAVSVLAFFEKLSPTAGVIFGSLAGYLFGKKEN